MFAWMELLPVKEWCILKNINILLNTVLGSGGLIINRVLRLGGAFRNGVLEFGGLFRNGVLGGLQRLGGRSHVGVGSFTPPKASTVLIRAASAPVLIASHTSSAADI